MKKQQLNRKWIIRTAKRALAFVAVLLVGNIATGCALHAHRASGVMGVGGVCHVGTQSLSDAIEKIEVTHSHKQLHLILERPMSALQTDSKTITRVSMSLWVGKGSKAQRVWPLAQNHYSSWEEASLRQRHSVPLHLLARSSGQNAEWRISLETLQWPRAGRCSKIIKLDVVVAFDPQTRQIKAGHGFGSVLALHARVTDPNKLPLAQASVVQAVTPLALSIPSRRRVALR